MKKAIITGATGFIGTAVVNTLLENEIAVIAIGRRNIKETSLFKFNQSKYFRYIELDVSNISLLPDILLRQNIKTDCSCVFYNFAWGSDKKVSDGDFNQQLNNIINSANSVVTAKQLSCSKFINCGSMEETFAEKYLQNNWKTNKYHSSQGCYALSKLASHELSMLTAYLEKIDYVHTRLSVPFDVNLKGKGYISKVFKNILAGQKFEKPSNNQLYDIISLSDVAKAYFLIGKYGINKANYFIGTSQPKTLETYFDLFYNYVNKRKSNDKINLATNTFLLDSKYFDNTKLVRDTGFRINDTFEQLIEQI